MTDAVFYLKAAPSKGVLPNAKHVALDPVAMGFGCGGADAYCSTAYSQMYSALGGAGKVLPTLRKKYGITGRVAFVSFSAGHGFLNPLLANEAPDAALLLDSTFGGGKAGYVKAAKTAASGGPLFATVTSDKGTTDALNNGDYAFQKFVLEPAGLSPALTSSQPPMPAGATVRKQGNLWYYRYPDAKLHHWDMGKVQSQFIEATLVPYWSGKLGGASSSKPIWLELGLVVLAAGATFWGVSRIANRQKTADNSRLGGRRVAEKGENPSTGYLKATPFEVGREHFGRVTRFAVVFHPSEYAEDEYFDLEIPDPYGGLPEKFIAVPDKKSEDADGEFKRWFLLNDHGVRVGTLSTEELRPFM